MHYSIQMKNTRSRIDFSILDVMVEVDKVVRGTRMMLMMLMLTEMRRIVP